MSVPVNAMESYVPSIEKGDPSASYVLEKDES